MLRLRGYQQLMLYFHKWLFLMFGLLYIDFVRFTDWPTNRRYHHKLAWFIRLHLMGNVGLASHRP